MILYNKQTKVAIQGDAIIDGYTDKKPLPDSSIDNLYCTFDEAFDKWTYNIDDVKRIKLEESKRFFEKAKSSYSGTVEYNSVLYNSDESSLKNTELTLKEMSKGTTSTTVQWRAADNSFHDLADIQLQELHDLIESDLFAKGLSLYQRKWDNEVAINSATDVDVLLNTMYNNYQGVV